MKRQKQLYKKAKKFYPILFWHKCCVCKEEFTRERGWSLLNRYERWVELRILSNDVPKVCAECCPTQKEAYERLVDVYGDRVFGVKPFQKNNYVQGDMAGGDIIKNDKV